MELIEASEKIEELLGEYCAKFSEFKIKNWADTYFVNSKEFSECTPDDKDLGFLCGSISIAASDAEDEMGMCGFDMFIEISKKRTIDEQKLENSISEFRSSADDLLKRLAEAPDKDEFIKAEAEREKAQCDEEMKKFQGELDKMDMSIKITIGAVVAILIISIIAAFIFA